MGKEKKCARSREWVAVERWEELMKERETFVGNFSHKNSPKKERKKASTRNE
jgi:hypothetical protein